MSERAEEDTVAVTIENRIAWVSYNRPEKRNCMSPKLNRQMMRVLEELEFRDDVGVLVLTGAGDAFSAGMDLQEYFRDNEALGLGAIRKSQREAYGWWDRLRWYEKPTIGMVGGWAFGGAYGPLHALDIVVAADEATFGLSEINWGILPAGLVSKVMLDSVSYRNAKFYALTGRPFDGRKAAEMGLIDFSVPAESLREETKKLAQELLAKNPQTYRSIKEALNHLRGMSADQANDYLKAKEAEMRFMDREQGRAQGMKQFLDDKTYRPGLGHYKRDVE